MASATILVVDDEESVRVFLRKILSMRGFDMVEAGSGAEALAHLERLGNSVNLLLTDIRMPGMNGVELARAAAELYPDLPVVYISGYPFDLESERRLRPKSTCAFLPKPFLPKALLETVQHCISPPKALHA